MKKLILIPLSTIIISTFAMEEQRQNFSVVPPVDSKQVHFDVSLQNSGSSLTDSAESMIIYSSSSDETGLGNINSKQVLNIRQTLFLDNCNKHKSCIALMGNESEQKLLIGMQKLYNFLLQPEEKYKTRLEFYKSYLLNVLESIGNDSAGDDSAEKVFSDECKKIKKKEDKVFLKGILGGTVGTLAIGALVVGVYHYFQ